MSSKSLSGFTLAELLIALAILGEIAVFSIPKIVSSQQQGTKKALLRETIANLSAVYNTGYTQNEMPSGSKFSYISSHLNAVKICSTNGSTQGCSTASKTSNWETYPTMVLHNGVHIHFFNAGADDFMIDWNGDAGPNIAGNDIVHVIGTTNNWVWCGVTHRKGAVSRLPAGCGSWSWETASNTLYEWTFQ